MNRSKPVVAIDGPAGSGKTTVSRLVAERLGYVVIDTGALYRTLALATRRAQLDPGQDGFVEFCQRCVNEQRIELRPGVGQSGQVLLDGGDVSEEIRTPEISQRASLVSVVPEVRHALLALQRSLGAGGGVVVEGRDIGSVVFPDAEAKFFVTASVERRATRRHHELTQTGTPSSLSSVMKQVEERDRRDSQRPVAPLRQAADAERVDTTDLSIDEVVAYIVGRVREIERRMAASGK